MDSAFGALLRQHRVGRRFSQLKLALEAGVSTRHLSFMETGRAQPSREMVLALAQTLEVPPRECNALLEAAGFAAAYRETPLDAAAMAEARRAVELLLRQNEPFGAVALDRHWNVVLANAAYARVQGLLLGHALPAYTVLPPGQHNALRALFHPEGLRQHVLNWEEVTRALVPRLVREAASGAPEAQALAKELLGYPGVPRAPAGSGAAALLIPLQLRVGEQVLRLFTTISTLGTAQDLTLAELRIESFHPADPATDAAVRALSAGL